MESGGGGCRRDFHWAQPGAKEMLIRTGSRRRHVFFIAVPGSSSKLGGHHAIVLDHVFVIKLYHQGEGGAADLPGGAALACGTASGCAAADGHVTRQTSRDGAGPAGGIPLRDFRRGGHALLVIGPHLVAVLVPGDDVGSAEYRDDLGLGGNAGL